MPKTIFLTLLIFVSFIFAEDNKDMSSFSIDRPASGYSFFRGGGRGVIPGVSVGLNLLGSYGSCYSKEYNGDGEYTQTLWSTGGGPVFSFYTRDYLSFNILFRFNAEFGSKLYKIEYTDCTLWETTLMAYPELGFEFYLSHRSFFRVLGGAAFMIHNQEYGKDRSDVQTLHNKAYLIPKASLELGYEAYPFKFYIGASAQYWRSENTRFFVDNDGFYLPKGSDLDRIYGRGYFGIQIGGI